jgi:hypothetical protein
MLVRIIIAGSARYNEFHRPVIAVGFDFDYLIIRVGSFVSLEQINIKDRMNLP